MRPLWLVLLSLLGLLCGGACVLLWPELVPASLRPAPRCPEPKSCAPSATAPRTPPPSAAGMVAPPASQPAAPQPPPGVVIARHALCSSPDALPTLRMLRLDAHASPVAAVHCGESLHLVAFDAAAGTLTPMRMARIDAHAPTPGMRLQPAHASAGDVNADGRTDLLVPFWWRDATGAPRAGAVYELLRSTSSGFETPALLSSVSASVVATGHFDDNPGVDLAILGQQDAAVGRRSEVVLMHGGPAPLKAATLTVGSAVTDAVALDLDVDGHDDLLLAGQKPALEAVYLNADGSVRERREYDDPKVRELLIADVDGDGHEDALLVGDTFSILLSTAQTTQPRLLHVPVSAAVRAAFPVDANADGKLDLVVLTSSAALLLTQNATHEFQEHPLFDLPRQWLPAGVAALPTEVNDQLALVLLGVWATKPEAELCVVPLHLLAAPSWNDKPTPLRDAPLSLQIVAR